MFRKIWQDLQISVRVFHGEDSSGAIRLSEDTDVAVCTIERANIILNQLLFDKQENSISMVVVDEVHMLGTQFNLLTHSLTGLLTHSLVYSLTHPPICSLAHSLTLTHLLTHSLTHSLTLTHSLLY